MIASDIREHLSAAVCSLDPEGEIPLPNTDSSEVTGGENCRALFS
jgi:hypothetical protein